MFLLTFFLLATHFIKPIGIITGGYLLGLVFEYLNISKSKHRDIDLFYIGDEQSDNDIDNFLKENNIDTYAFYVKSDDYEIVSQAKYGEFNYIKLTCGGNFKWENLISHFDLNCIKIGIYKEGDDLNLIIHKEFLYFLNNKEVLILNSFNLESSIPRSLRKICQYPFLKFNLNYL